MKGVKRYGLVLGVKKEKIEEYKKLHANIWPDVLKALKKCNLCNHSIYLREIEKDKFYLFSYIEYTGDDFEADMKKMATAPIMQKWDEVTKLCQQPVETHAKGQWWVPMEEVFHMD
jgi:L-rhamnose mutarotase